MASEFRWIGRSLDGDRVSLERFTGKFQLEPALQGEPQLRVIVLDVETTGLDPQVAKVIEIGAREAWVEATSGRLVKVGASFQAFSDPGHPLSAETIRLTGITDADLAGRSIDVTALANFLKGADWLVAHNASFDRPFVERICAQASQQFWACSFEQIDWTSKAFPSRKLEILSIYHGFFVDAHRALEDSDALMHLLSFPRPDGKGTYFKEMFARALEPVVRVSALNSPFETKDILKARGYHWNGKDRVWQRKLLERELEAETNWLTENVYHGRFRGQVEAIDPLRNFSGR